MTGRIWILGAADPEMEAIEGLLRECGEHVVHARRPDGERVLAGDAYRCAPIHIGKATRVYCVECEPPLAVGSPEGEPDVGQIRIDGLRYASARHYAGISVTQVDHHRPGDPGYGRGARDYMEASSLGQVIHGLALEGVDIPTWEEHAPLSALARSTIPEPGLRRHNFFCQSILVAAVAGGGTREVVLGEMLSPDERGTRLVEGRVTRPRVMRLVPDEVRLAAAADHCLGAAYRGECPGVDPNKLMYWRADSRARFQGRAIGDVLADVERAREALRAAPVIALADGVEVRDMRGQRVPELPEASARAGVCFVADGLPDRDGRVKIVCQSGAPEQIRAFTLWAQAQGLVDIYGDPARGFAGGYEVADSDAGREAILDAWGR